jgi:hypothetical protein
MKNGFPRNMIVLSTLSLFALLTPLALHAQTVYEANASANAIEGAAKVVACSGCLNGERVGYIGLSNSNYLRIKSISVPTTGSYTVTVYYEVSGTRSATIQINNVAISTSALTNVSGTSWTTPKTASFTANFTAGSTNSVGFFNATASAPDIDHITVSTSGGGGGGGGTTGKTFAPFEYVGDLGDANQVPGIVSASGAKGVILAFLVPSGNGCNLEWPGANGVQPNDTIGSTSMATVISQLQASGVTVGISQGGAGGQDASGYCSSASATQAVYQELITKYNVKWLDFDIEWGETSGQPTRRAQALAALQKANPGLTISFTLPADTGGLNSGTNGGTTDITDAISAGVSLTIVNAMAMDFGNQSTDQATLADETAAAVESQIKSGGWNSAVGVTVLPGTSDDSGAVKFSLADATTVLNFANANSYVTLLSFWELNRDNGGCSGSSSDEDTCSGISQSNYQFSSIFKAF